MQSIKKILFPLVGVIMSAVAHDEFAFDSSSARSKSSLSSSPTTSFSHSRKIRCKWIVNRTLNIKRGGGGGVLAAFSDPVEREGGEKNKSNQKGKNSGSNNDISKSSNTFLFGSIGVIGLSSTSRNTIRFITSTLTKISSSTITFLTKSTSSCWILLFSAILVDILSTYVTKIASDTQSTSKLIMALGTYLFSQVLFAGSLSKINVGMAYAVWSALGTAVVSGFGMAFFGENCGVAKVLCLSMVIGGVVGLNLLDDAP